MEDIFNLSSDDFKQPEKKSLSNFYNPDPKEAKDGVYRAVLRFMPNLANVKQSIVKKSVHWLSEGDRSGFYADCPSSIGEKSIVSDAYWKLKKSSSAYEQKQAESIGYKEYYFSYVYVVKDFQKPELNGTVQVLRYPKTVRKLIEAQLNPDPIAIEQGAVSTNVFHLFEGKDFYLAVGTKSNFKNYDNCKFADKRQPITVNGQQMQQNEECKKAISALYAPDLPALDTFGYKPWSEELQSRVYAFLSSITGSKVSAAVSAVAAPDRQQPLAEARAAISEQTTSATSDVVTPAASDAELNEWLKNL